MATQKIADRVKDTAASITGTGSYTLNASPPTGFQSFNSGIGDGNTTVYCATDGSANWEVCLGTYTDSTKALTRNLVSSSSGSLISWSAATPTIFVVDAAELAGMWTFGIQSGRRFAQLQSSANTTSTFTSGNVYAVGIIINKWFTSITPSINVTALFAGTATMDIAVYDNLDGAPNNLIGSTTGINVGTSGSTGDVAGSAITSICKPPGLYWGAIAMRTNSATVRAQGATACQRWFVGASSSTDNNNYGGWQVTNAGLPNPFGAPTANTSTGPFVTLAVS
jgi:hypothetical protein